MKKTILLASVLLSSSALAGAEPQHDADRAMKALGERYVDDSLRLQPIDASYVGYRKHDGLWPDYTPGGVARALEFVARYELELAGVTRTKLSTPFAMDLDMLKDDVAELGFFFKELRSFAWDPQLYNEAIGAGFYYLTYEPKHASEWPARLDSILARMRGLPAFLASAEQNLTNAPKPHVEFAISANPGNKDVFDKQLPALFAKHPKHKAEFERLVPGCKQAIDGFQLFLEKKLLPKANHPWQLGRDKWQKKLRFSLASTVDPEVLYKDAERDLEKTRARMYDLALPLYAKYFPGDKAYEKLSGDARVNWVVGKVIERASLKHGTPSSLFSDVERYSARIRKFIKDKDLITMPPADDNFVVEPTPSFLDGMAVAFFNPSPALEPWLKKSYWISTVPKTGSGDAAKDRAFAESFLREYNDYGLQTLTIHEALPGHYVQLYWSQRSPYATLPKQVMESGTMAEGWAVLIEDVLYEQGYASGEPENELFHLKMNLRSYMNAMIDRKLHASVEADGSPAAAKLEAWALELLQTKGFQEEAEAKRKLRRAKLTSTQLSTYFVGYREMREILQAAQQRAGSKATLKSILDRMLSYGTIPPRLIRELMLEDKTI